MPDLKCGSHSWVLDMDLEPAGASASTLGCQCLTAQPSAYEKKKKKKKTTTTENSDMYTCFEDNGLISLWESYLQRTFPILFLVPFDLVTL